jgi:tRNA-splicing ligase RtcB
MSFKYQAIQVSDCEWLLEKGVSSPISIFMNQKLYDASEEEMWRQATWATNIPSVKKIVITPDAHAGAGVPVGVVVATENYIAPCAAGYDISCGMLSMKTSLKSADITTKEIRRVWMKAVEDRVAVGAGYQRSTKQAKISSNLFQEILQHGMLAFNETSKIKDRFERTHHEVKNFVNYKRAEERGSGQLGSLGGGNHFLELQQDSEGNVWIMIHTGSRGYGHQVATEFFNEGLQWWNDSHSSSEQLAKSFKEQISFPVDSDIGKRYINGMAQAANFAIVNRYLIAKAIIDATEEVFKSTPEIYYEISHNLVQYEEGLWVHRKGATRALPAGHNLLKGTEYENIGHPILIPGSMGTSSALLIPVDSAKSLYSVNHGCGRVMSRGQAKRTFNGETLDKEMDDMDILYNSRHVPIDESLHCYKDIDEVLDTVESAGLAKVTVRLYPRAVIKGND